MSLNGDVGGVWTRVENCFWINEEWVNEWMQWMNEQMTCDEKCNFSKFTFYFCDSSETLYQCLDLEIF